MGSGLCTSPTSWWISLPRTTHRASGPTTRMAHASASSMMAQTMPPCATFSSATPLIAAPRSRLETTSSTRFPTCTPTSLRLSATRAMRRSLSSTVARLLQMCGSGNLPSRSTRCTPWARSCSAGMSTWAITTPTSTSTTPQSKRRTSRPSVPRSLCHPNARALKFPSARAWSLRSRSSSCVLAPCQFAPCRRLTSTHPSLPLWI
mmetsp:Transcript_36270/g.82272  ORF Transcript_36270/g.82272 Transcript_36270/m.82272 type:complete len:205 (-) Transcript_36270:165-779(-)